MAPSALLSSSSRACAHRGLRPCCWPQPPSGTHESPLIPRAAPRRERCHFSAAAVPPSRLAPLAHLSATPRSAQRRCLEAGASGDGESPLSPPSPLALVAAPLPQGLSPLPQGLTLDKLLCSLVRPFLSLPEAAALRATDQPPPAAALRPLAAPGGLDALRRRRGRAARLQRPGRVHLHPLLHGQQRNQPRPLPLAHPPPPAGRALVLRYRAAAHRSGPHHGPLHRA